MHGRPRLARRYAALASLLTLALTLLPVQSTGAAERARDLGVTAQITVTPATAYPGTHVTVSGLNFQSGETVDIGFNRLPMVNVVASADGVIASTSITVPVSTAAGTYNVYAWGLSSMRLAVAPVTVVRLQPKIQLNATSFDVQRTACVSGSGFGPTEEILVKVDNAIVSLGQADGSGDIDICFSMPKTIISGNNSLTVQGLTTGAMARAQFTGMLPLSQTYYFAGGSTDGGDVTQLPVFNPGSLRARMTLTFYTRTKALRHRIVTLAAHGHTVVPVGVIVGKNNVFGVEVHADKPLAATLLVHRRTGSPYALPGTSALKTTWYLAEGNTDGTFHELVHILNPGSHKALVDIQAVPSGTAKPRSEFYTVPAKRIATLELNRLYPHQQIAAIVTSNKPVFITRVMTYGPGASGANANAATSALQRKWYFSDGSVSNGTQTFLSVLNPSKNQRATLTINMYDDNGQRLFLHSERVAPNQRSTIRLNDVLYGVVPMTGTFDFSMAITSSVPMALERSIYYGKPDAGRVASAVMSGPGSPGLTWDFATGDTTAQAHEFLSVFNPTALPASVEATYVVTSGTTTKLDFTLPPLGRTTVDAASDVPDLPPSVHSVEVTSSDFVPIIAEQGVYSPTITSAVTSITTPPVTSTASSTITSTATSAITTTSTSATVSGVTSGYAVMGMTP